MTRPIPEGYRNVNVILTVDDAARAIDFYKQAFGATEISRLPMGDKIGHAELQIGDTRIMLNDEFPERDNLGPKARGGTPEPARAKLAGPQLAAFTAEPLRSNIRLNARKSGCVVRKISPPHGCSAADWPLAMIVSGLPARTSNDPVGPK